MEVKGFNNHELNEAFRVSPEIVCNYISALHKVLEMSEETNKKALAKIKELSNITVEEVATIISEAGFLRGWEEENERFDVAESILKGIKE